MANRRQFLTSLLAVSAAPTISWASVGSPSFIAAAKVGDDYALCGITDAGQIAFQVPLPARGHAGAGHPTKPIAVAFARRPGTFVMVIDCLTGAVMQELSAPEGRSFSGHGMFLDDGNLLLTTEQIAETSEGFLGLWDASDNFKRIGAIPTHGLGPHDVKLLDDGATLVVANGGIHTDAFGRTKLNIETMRPNLAYLSIDGLLDMVELDPELSKNSIRHLAVRPDGLVGFAMQWQADPSFLPPILGLHKRETGVILAEAPLNEAFAMQGYAGSIAFSGDGREIAISSPKGGRLHRFTDTGEFIAATMQSDVCGLVTLAGGYMSSDGYGHIAAMENGALRPLAEHPVNWDNHIIAL